MRDDARGGGWDGRCAATRLLAGATGFLPCSPYRICRLPNLRHQPGAAAATAVAAPASTPAPRNHTGLGCLDSHPPSGLGVATR